MCVCVGGGGARVRAGVCVRVYARVDVCVRACVRACGANVCVCIQVILQFSEPFCYYASVVQRQYNVT